MKLSEELKWRGFVNQTTYPDLSVLDDKIITFYHGFDASADSQTIGNLAGMMLDKVFIRHGHKAVILAGGATSLIGDPGGKDSERPLQDEQTISSNIVKAEEQLRRVFSGQEFKLVNNLDWTKDLKVIDFLRDYGKHFSMTPLIQRDYIAKRLGADAEGISYAEFSYTVLQGMDFLHLYDNEEVTLQIGGSDQWGNCLSGVELIRKSRGAEVHVITLPLIINKSTGNKFGKTEEGAIWLDPAKTTPYDFYQFWINTPDDAVEEYLKIFTELDQSQISETMQKFWDDRANRSAQRILAREVTKLVHNEDIINEIEAAASAAYSDDNITPDAIPILKSNLINVMANANGSSIVEILVNSGLANSKGDARRLISSGGVSINGQRVEDINAMLERHNIIHGHAILQRGKTKAIIEVTE
jgi:tyrosyl-tRNA synthetase